MWNRRENRKISGNAAPMEKNIDEYLRKHPECELYISQRSQMDPAVRAAQLAADPRITIWNKTERRKVSGNAAPLEKNIDSYLRKHPDTEIYDGQDKRAPGALGPAASSGPRAAWRQGLGQLSGHMVVPRMMPVPQLAPGGKEGGWESPKSTLDLLAMIACQENLNLLHAEDYSTDAEEELEEEEEEEEEEETGGEPVKEEGNEAPLVGEKREREQEGSALDQLLKKVKPT